ncbi:MAG TPA: hypothetical protein DF712_13320 [Balneola sp.]|nr:hypothetical protein [Balneola sp.]
MTGFTITEFAGKLATFGLASPNKFKVRFDGIPVGPTDRQLDFMCEQVDIAGRSVQSIMNLEYGIRREIAYNAPAYNPLNLTFICTGDFKEKRILDQWNNLIVDSTNGFDVAYYDTYAKNCSLNVTSLKPDGVTKAFTITYREVYPKSIQSIQLNHSTQNTTLRVNAEMQYAYFETDDINFANVQPAFTSPSGP